MIKGNKGEWSELYVLLYLLGTGRLYAANEKVQRLQDVYFPILKIEMIYVNKTRWNPQ